MQKWAISWRSACKSLCVRCTATRSLTRLFFRAACGTRWFLLYIHARFAQFLESTCSSAHSTVSFSRAHFAKADPWESTTDFPASAGLQIVIIWMLRSWASAALSAQPFAHLKLKNQNEGKQKIVYCCLAPSSMKMMLSTPFSANHLFVVCICKYAWLASCVVSSLK